MDERVEWRCLTCQFSRALETLPRWSECLRRGPIFGVSVPDDFGCVHWKSSKVDEFVVPYREVK